MAEVLGSNVYTVNDEDPSLHPSEDTLGKSLSHSASSDTLKEVTTPSLCVLLLNINIAANIYWVEA